MTRQPSNTREALIVELLGDVQSVLDRLGAVKAELATAEQSAAKTTQAVNDATDRYRAQVDETVQRLRTETDRNHDPDDRTRGALTRRSTN